MSLWLCILSAIILFIWICLYCRKAKKRAEQELFEWERARRHKAIKQGVEEYLEAKKRWEEGENDE